MVADRMTEEIRLERRMIERLDAMLSRCVLRLEQSRAPESRALGEEAEETLLALAAAVARYDKLVALHGGEGRRPAYVEPAAEGGASPFGLAVADGERAA
jgi:hypothetical protein